MAVFSEKKQSLFGLFFAVVLFVVLDTLILIVNYWITYQVEKDAFAINIAGRQRMLTQRQTKSLLEIRMYLQHGETIVPSVEELKKSTTMFSETINAFNKGGIITAPNGDRLMFSSVDDEAVQDLVKRTFLKMEPVNLKLKIIISDKEISLVEINDAVKVMLSKNVELLDLSNHLTIRMEQLSKNKTLRLRWIQAVIYFMALLNFIVILMIFSRRFKHDQQSLKSLSQLIDNVGNGILGVDKNKVIISNIAACHLFGCSAIDFKGQDISNFILYSEDENKGVDVEGNQFPIEINTSSIKMFGQPIELLSITDISHLKMHEAELIKIANQDALTGLATRRVMFDRLELEINNSKRYETLLGIMFIDLDGFKKINDNRGHDVGDCLLKLVSKRLVSSARKTDTVVRYGGDEFVILLPKIESSGLLMDLAKRYIAGIAKPYYVEGQELVIGCSIGSAVYPEHAATAHELLQLSDQMMYQAKKQGGNICVMASPHSHQDDAPSLV